MVDLYKYRNLSIKDGDLFSGVVWVFTSNFDSLKVNTTFRSL